MRALTCSCLYREKAHFEYVLFRQDCEDKILLAEMRRDILQQPGGDEAFLVYLRKDVLRKQPNGQRV